MSNIDINMPLVRYNTARSANSTHYKTAPIFLS
ncbi:hypothetical protein PSPO_a6000 [Pseudoalteromonas spongiae UST010723-006]|nr:hypothetical protein PSPO_a6000 [Pseudoalteromonas spongiae UST010723-006]